MKYGLSARPLVAALLCCVLLPRSAGAVPIQYQYDALGRVIAVTYPNGEQITYSYDAAGNRTQTVTAATSGNKPPDAVDDLKTWLDSTATFTFDPRTNDTDPEGNAITIVGAGAPQWGTSSFTGTSLSYIAPNTRLTEQDSFNYTIQDTAGGRDTAVVTIQLGNLPPTPVADAISTAPNVPITFGPTTNDTDPGGDPISLTGVGTPAHGTTTFSGNSITYRPTPGYRGSDSFSYTVTDADGASASSTVAATVQGPNHPPVANPVGFVAWIVAGKASGNVNVCQRDTDADGDPLTVVSVTAAPVGTSSFGTCTVGWKGSGTGEISLQFTYTISDGQGGTASNTVSVDVVKSTP